MKKKNILQIEQSADFEIVGISIAIKDFSFCSKLNNMLDFKFDRHIINIPEFHDNKDGLFSVFYYNDHENYMDYFLINNKGIIDSTEKLVVKLIPEYKNMDFFMIILENDKEDFIENLRNNIREKTSATTLKIDSNSLKINSIEYFNFIISHIKSINEQMPRRKIRKN
ncbi:MAG: hypothetical protein A2X12_08765 [Bacteroidetes bacterium GWE2_29_8]|nr:MAG: hypothetical protein A2X12_08765 [Bacteroidetes bacterium GWE2_29_8]OFY18353.1 MAG: hypothetical protein A2X02_08425 [Bacteroidetes bacterium GWF2_29_10]